MLSKSSEDKVKREEEIRKSIEKQLTALVRQIKKRERQRDKEEQKTKEKDEQYTSVW